MIVDLVRTVTRDGLRLDGAYQPVLPSSKGTIDLDAVCFLHGTGSNFYSSTLFDALTECFRELGCGVLRANTRGHDLMSVASVVQGGGKIQGAAYEMVEDCRHDVAAWMDWLRQRVGRRIGLLGHSLGAVKALYAIAQEPKLAPKCVIAVSPPHLSYSWFCASAKHEEFLSAYQQAEEHVEAGGASTLMQVRFPIPFVITAGGYVEKYGPEERYNYLNFISGLICPTLVTLGEIEVSNNVAFQKAPAELERLSRKHPVLSSALIPEADHFYTQAREALIETIQNWADRHLRPKSAQNDWQI